MHDRAPDASRNISTDEECEERLSSILHESMECVPPTNPKRLDANEWHVVNESDVYAFARFHAYDFLICKNVRTGCPEMPPSHPPSSPSPPSTHKTFRNVSVAYVAELRVREHNATNVSVAYLEPYTVPYNLSTLPPIQDSSFCHKLLKMSFHVHAPTFYTEYTVMSEYVTESHSSVFAWIQYSESNNILVCKNSDAHSALHEAA